MRKPRCCAICSSIRGARVLRLHADPNARAFYVHLGMRQTGEIASIAGNGRTLPVMELDLTD